MTISANFPNVQPSLLLDFANAKQLPPSVNFTRATTAAYYDGNTTAKAEENLLTYSEQFDNAIWSKSNVTITANSTTAPDGTATADTVTQSAGTGTKFFSQQSPGTAGRPYAASIYAKAGTNNFNQFLFGGVNTDFANFNISAGTVGTTLGVSSATITSVGSGWYRCVVTWNSLGTDFTSYAIAVIPSSTSVRAETTSDTNTVFLWGAQLEQRSSATAYTATTTQPITNYIPVLLTAGGGQPRFDHNPTTSESLGLLIEDQRTNLMLQSEAVGTSPWSGLATAVEANTIVSPDGAVDGDKVYEGTGNNYQNRFQSVAQTATTYAFSVYAKKGQTDRFVMFAGSPQALLWIDMTTWTVFASTNVVSSSITAVGNGWYRCTLIYTNTSASSFQTGINLVQVGTTNTVLYAGNGFNGMYLWGAQLEVGAVATSYIPTTSASATRAADLMYYSGASMAAWFNNGEGTVFMDCVPNSSTGYLYAFSDGTGNNRWQVDITNTSVGLYDAVGGTAQVSFGFGNITVGTQFKIAAAFQNSDFAATLNAGSVSNQTSGLVPPMTFAYIGTSADGNVNSMLKGWIKKFSYYPQRLTNAQLQALTS